VDLVLKKEKLEIGGRRGGIFLGALTITVIENGLVLLRIPYFWTYIIFGLVIISSVLSSLYLERKRLGRG